MITPIKIENLPFETPEQFFSSYPSWQIAFQNICRSEKIKDPEEIEKLKFAVMQVKAEGDENLEPRQAIRSLVPARKAKNSQTLQKVLKFAVSLFLNIFTGGLYTLISHHLNVNRIQVLEKKQLFNEQFYNEQKRRALLTAKQLGDAENFETVLKDEDASGEITLPHSLRSATDPVILETLKCIVELERENKEKEGILEEIKDQKRSLREVSSAIGWVEPLYKKAADDPSSIRGKYISSKQENLMLPSSFVNGKKTMTSLLESVFDGVTEALLYLDQTKIIHFNRSEKMLTETEEISPGIEQRKYADNLTAVHNFMAFLLIRQSGLETECDQETTKLVLNIDGLSVRSSQPFKAKTPDGKEEVIVFKNVDDWTPDENCHLPNGVDPIAAKWCLNRLKKEQKSLAWLLLSPLMSKSSPLLIKALEKRNSDTPLGALLRAAENLFTDIGLMFYEKYNETLSKKWIQFATDVRSTPFHKATDGKEVPTVMQNEEEELNKVTEWKPLENPIRPFVIDKYLFRDLDKTLKLIAPIFRNFRPDLLINPLRDNGTARKIKSISDLKDQYWVLHLNIKDQRCLFSALAAGLLSGSGSKSKIDPRRLKEAMAKYLEAGAGERLQDFIRAETKAHSDFQGWTWDQYVRFLSGSSEPELGLRDSMVFGSLELEILARALQINIEVFHNAGFYQVINGLKRSSCQYGPKNMKERIILYCKDTYPSSFYALFPKVKNGNSGHSAELKRALKFANNYWGVNDGIEYSYWDNFIYPK